MPSLVQTMACCLFGAKPVTQPHCWLDPWKKFHCFLNQNATVSYMKMISVRWQLFCLSFNMFAHWGWVTHICASNLCQHWFRKWLVTRLVPSHYLNQCRNIVSWTPRNKLQWNSNRNSYIFIQENPFENVVWKMAAISSQPRWVSIYEFHPENGQALLETKGIVINWFCERGT